MLIKLFSTKTTWVGDYGLEIPDNLIQFHHRSRVDLAKDRQIVVNIFLKPASVNGCYYFPTDSAFRRHKCLSFEFPALTSEKIGSIVITNFGESHQLQLSQHEDYHGVSGKCAHQQAEQGLLTKFHEEDRKRYLDVDLNDDALENDPHLLKSGIIEMIIILFLHFKHVHDVTSIRVLGTLNWTSTLFSAEFFQNPKIQQVRI